MKYQTKPCEIEAIQWTGNNIKEVLVFMGSINADFTSCCAMAEERWYEYCESIRKEGLHIDTLEGVMKASINDYIIRGLGGEYYPCKPEIFNMKYECVCTTK